MRPTGKPFSDSFTSPNPYEVLLAVASGKFDVAELSSDEARTVIKRIQLAEGTLPEQPSEAKTNEPAWARNAPVNAWAGFVAKDGRTLIGTSTGVTGDGKQKLKLEVLAERIEALSEYASKLGTRLALANDRIQSTDAPPQGAVGQTSPESSVLLSRLSLGLDQLEKNLALINEGVTRTEQLG